MALSSKQQRYVETVLAGLPHLAEAVAAIPPDWQPAAFQAAERSYLKAFRQLELSGPQTWASSVMRRLRRRVREAEKEKLTKLYEQLSANEHRSALPFGQAHSFDPHQAALSEEQKNVGGELSADEQIGQAHSSLHARQPHQKSKRTWEENSLLTSKLVKRTVSLHTRQPHQKSRTWEENSLLTSKLAKRTVRYTRGSIIRRAYVGGELSADEQIGEAHSFATHEAALSEEQKNVARESVKKDAVALRMAGIMIKVDEIFDDGRRPMVDEQSSNRRTHSDSSKG